MSYDSDLDLPFRIAFLAMTAAYTAIRSYYARETERRSTRIVVRKPSDALRVRLLNLFGMAGSVATIVYIVIPQWMTWSAVPLPDWARWLGGGAGFAATGLFFWTHKTLGSNWSGSLVLREDHALVTTGPYRLARHPMYDAVIGTSLGGFLLTANWFIGLTGLGSALILATRIGEEEQMLREGFGSEYDAYARRTGRFAPRISSVLPPAWSKG